MFRRVVYLLVLPLVFSSVFSCVHADPEERKKIADRKKMQRYAKKSAEQKKNIRYRFSDQFNKNTKSTYVVESALERGMPTLDKAVRFLKATKKWKPAQKHLANILWNLAKRQELAGPDSARLMRAAALYQQSPYRAQPKLVQGLLSAKNTTGNQAGLIIAASKPSPKVRAVLDTYFSKQLASGDMSVFASPLVADAVQANRMRSNYSLMKQSLMVTGNESFARTMASLSPRQASRDFLEYLNLANYEELRQLHLKQVNVMTCSLIFGHLARFHAPIEDPNFVTLFLYATSRNEVLAKLAERALEPLIRKHRHYLASLLARMPPNVQISFVDSSRHNLSPIKKLFLRDFRRITANEDVHFEVDSLRL